MHDPSAVAKLLVWLPRPAVEGAKGFVRTQVPPPRIRRPNPPFPPHVDIQIIVHKDERDRVPFGIKVP